MKKKKTKVTKKKKTRSKQKSKFDTLIQKAFESAYISNCQLQGLLFLSLEIDQDLIIASNDFSKFLERLKSLGANEKSLKHWKWFI